MCVYFDGGGGGRFVRVCVHACARACLHVCACVSVCLRVYVCVRVYIFATFRRRQLLDIASASQTY